MCAYPKLPLPTKLGVLKGGLKDLSVSRKSFTWGIKVPSNSEHVIYVWLDALTNYLSALNYPDINDTLYKNFWPVDVNKYLDNHYPLIHARPLH